MVIKITGTTFSSDLRKPCWITGESWSPLSKKSPVLEKSHISKIKLFVFISSTSLLQFTNVIFTVKYMIK